MRSHSADELTIGVKLEEEEEVVDDAEEGDEWEDKVDDDEESEPTAKKVRHDDGEDLPALFEDWQEQEEYA